MSLAAHCIRARMTNWFTQTGLSTCELHQLFTRLWWWFSLRLLKCQSPLLTRVPPRTTLTQTIRLHYKMFPHIQTIYCIMVILLFTENFFHLSIFSWWIQLFAQRRVNLFQRVLVLFSCERWSCVSWVYMQVI